MQTLVQVLTMWHYRHQTYKQVSMLRLTEVMIFSALAFLFRPHGVQQFMLANLVAQSAPAIFLVIKSKSAILGALKALGQFSFKEIAWRYREFPRVNILQGLLDLMQLNLIVLMMSGSATDKEMGYLGMCFRVLQIPLWLLIRPLANVYFAEASRRHMQHQSLRHFFVKTLRRAIPFAALVPAVLVPFGPWAFGLAFGKNWSVAGLYASILSVWIFFDLLRVPIAQTATIVGKQRYVLYASILMVVFLFAALRGAIWFNASIIQILMVATAIQSLASMAIIYINYKVVT
jgi:O-antigen/teichoic acid export membrane protein